VPAPQPPFILADNILDRINLYPLATIIDNGGASVVGREVNFWSDYRRERSYHQLAAPMANVGPLVDLGVGNTAVVDTIWIDRGHNLWGKTLYADGSTSGSSWSDPNLIIAQVVPAQGTVGGDPTTGWCVTEEGALYTLAVNSVARRYWRLYVVESVAPTWTGVILGKRVQLLNFSSIRDEDAGGRTERITESDAAYQAVERVYPYRTLQLSLDLIGAAEYDSSIRSLRATLFERNQPAFIVMNYGDKPERGWLMQYQGKGWSSPMNRVHRKWSGTFREVGALIR
jgi:hypothetical protein